MNALAPGEGEGDDIGSAGAPAAGDDTSTADLNQWGSALRGALDELSGQLSGLTELFTEAGYRVYVVGGWVRDQLVAASGGAGSSQTDGGWTDVDLTTDALPEATEELLRRWAHAVWTTGADFGTVGGERNGLVVEVTTHRGEAYVQHSRKPTVEFSDDVVVDLSRRDFTVNAMAVGLPGGEFIDPHGGAADLAARQLRAPSEPVGLLRDDPLRIVRAARFAARFNLEPTVDLVAAMRSERERLAIVAQQRLNHELMKLLLLPAPGRGVELLAETGVLGQLFGWLGGDAEADAVGVLESTDGPAAGNGDVDPAELGARVDRLASSQHGWGEEVNLFGLRLAALLFEAGESGARATLRTLEFPTVVVATVTGLLRKATAVLTLAEGPPPSAEHLRRHLATVGTDPDVAPLLTAVGHSAACRTVEQLDDIQQREGLPAVSVPLDGNDVIKLATALGVELEGVEVGDALRHLLELHVLNGPLSRSDAEAALTEYWSDSTQI